MWRSLVMMILSVVAFAQTRTFSPTLRQTSPTPLSIAQVDGNFSGTANVANSAARSYFAGSQIAMLSLSPTPQAGDWCWRSDTSFPFIFLGGDATSLSSWASLPAYPSIPVASVFGRTGGVTAQTGDYTVAQVTNAASAVTLAASGGSSTVGFLQAGTGAVARTLQAKDRDRVSIKDFGAVGDGIADDTAAIQAAIDAASPGEVFIPASTGFYKTTSPLTLRSGLRLVGAGYGAGNAAPIGSSIIKNSVSDIFVNGAAAIQGAVFEGFTARSLAGGGHIFNLNGAGAVTGCEWKNVVLIQDNAAKAALTATGSGGFFANHLHDFAFAYAPSSSIPAINLVNPALSHVVIENFYSYGSNTSAGAYSIWLEGTGGTQGYSCAVRQGVFESPGGGGINLLSCITTTLEGCVAWDLSVVPANPFINVGKSATTAGGSQIDLYGCRSTYGSAGVTDLKFDGAAASVSVSNSFFTYVDGTTTVSASFLSSRNSSLINLANLRWTAENSYLPSASISLGTYLYASGINNTIISRLDTSGNWSILGGTATTSVTQTASNSSLSLKGNRDAADAGPDIVSNSSRARSAGNLHAFQNNGTNVAAVNWSGGLLPGQLNAGGTASSSAVYSGTGAPSNTYGNNGDYYLRSDTPGTANQRLYVKSAGSWVGVL